MLCIYWVGGSGYDYLMSAAGTLRTTWACHKNPQCNKLNERIVAKGKSKKLTLIAVSNKLLKLAFAVAKSGIPYDPNYKGSFAQV